MYLEAGMQHHTHIFMHTIRMKPVYSALTPVGLIAGDFSRKQWRLVKAWAELHEQELIEDWHLLQSGRLPDPIEPLK